MHIDGVTAYHIYRFLFSSGMGAVSPRMRSRTTAVLKLPKRFAFLIIALAYGYVGVDYIWRSTSTSAACSRHSTILRSQVDTCLRNIAAFESRESVDAYDLEGRGGDARPQTAVSTDDAKASGSVKRKLLSRSAADPTLLLREGGGRPRNKGSDSISSTRSSGSIRGERWPTMQMDVPDLSSGVDSKEWDRNSLQFSTRPEAMANKIGRRKLLAEVSVPLASYLDCSAATGFSTYMNYKPYQPCPDDWQLAQLLLLDGRCLSLGLPRRNCFARMPKSYEAPVKFPDSLWVPPKDENVRWSLYPCKSYECLNNRTKGDCRECFMFTGEAKRWVWEREGKMTLPQVLKIKGGGKVGPGGGGSIRVGLDVGGGTASFAAQMVAYDVIVMTSGINIEAPFLETIAQRGFIGLHMSHLQRLPLFDGSMDMIHSMHSVQFLMPDLFMSLIFDWDRCLRPGGILWLEYLYIPAEEMEAYEKVLGMMGYVKHEWFMETYFDKARNRNMKRLSVVLEKPLSRSPKETTLEDEHAS